MQNRFLLLFFLVSVNVVAQDFIKLRNGQEINCKITRQDSTVIFYEFTKGDRTLSSFVSRSDIREYRFSAEQPVADSSSVKTLKSPLTVVVDTTAFVRETNKWLSMITFSRIYGITSNGWSVQYQGYNIIGSTRWSIPIVFGVESFMVYPDYMSTNSTLTYMKAGISPIYRITDRIHLNLGCNILYGNTGDDGEDIFFGFNPSEGIYYVPKSKFGIVVGLGLYQKLLSTTLYTGDVGVKLEIGIKF